MKYVTHHMQLRNRRQNTIVKKMSSTSNNKLRSSLSLDDVMAFRHTIVRLMSLCHGSALEEISGGGGQAEVDTTDPWGLDIDMFFV